MTIIVPPHVYDQLHGLDPKRETDQQIKALIDQGSRQPAAPQPNRATRRRHRK